MPSIFYYYSSPSDVDIVWDTEEDDEMEVCEQSLHLLGSDNDEYESLGLNECDLLLN